MKTHPIDAYLAKTPQPQRKTLTALRATLRRLLPRAEEALAYGMPCFKVDGKGVAGFAAFKEHCGYFPMSGSVVAALEKELGRYTISKGGVQFAVDAPLPPALVKKLVRARLEELSTRPSSGTGPAISYYDNGVVASRGRFKGGRMHGTWEFFRRDGSVMRTGEFRDGEQAGTWVTWDKNGRKVKETRF